MNIEQLYDVIPQRETYVLGELENSAMWNSLLPEIDDTSNLWLVPEDENTKVKICTIHEFYFDGRRNWCLRSIWYENHPVMIAQNAGREGDDHIKTFITDKTRYIAMIGYIEGLIKKQFNSFDHEIYDTTTDIPELTRFYGGEYFADGTFRG